MQTFLPHSDFDKCAKWLDDKRLNKQIVEAYQILTDRVPNKNHPACLMWDGNKHTLYTYIVACCDEYEKRYGKKHSILSKINEDDYQDTEEFFLDVIDATLLILSHKVNLFRKDSSHYSKCFRIYDPIDSYPEGYYWYKTKGKVSTKHKLAWEKWAELNKF